MLVHELVFTVVQHCLDALTAAARKQHYAAPHFCVSMLHACMRHHIAVMGAHDQATYTVTHSSVLQYY
eukprot:16689-Heterococcus_DN1.PRE.15